MKQPVDGFPGLFKDSETGVISNRSDDSRSKYRIAKQQALQNQQNSEEIHSLRSEIDEIKSLLHQLLNK